MTKNKETIIQYLLKQIHLKNADYIKKTMENFDVASSTIYNYIAELESKNVIEKTNADFKYQLVSEKTYFEYSTSDLLEEDRIFNKDISPLLSHLDSNVFESWRYAFTEMMNNAIEHSSAQNIYCRVVRNDILTEIAIVDDGIGIFRNIQNYIKATEGKELELSECVALLFAGKFTTASEAHSGEGIFFTSHLMDEFFIRSDDMIFARDNFRDRMGDSIIKPNIINARTVVCMSLYNKSLKTTEDVFYRFSDMEEGFFKTHIPVAQMFVNGSPISRSEARRLGEMVKDFKEVCLDFANVEHVGQAFVHELFVVWAKRNPDKTIICENTSEKVENFIKRVCNTK